MSQPMQALMIWIAAMNGKREQHRPGKRVAELRAGLRIGGDAAGIIVRGTRDQPGAERAPQFSDARFFCGHATSDSACTIGSEYLPFSAQQRGCTMSILGWAIFGAITGFIASKIVNRRGEGCILNIALGLVGALVGGAIFRGIIRLRRVPLQPDIDVRRDPRRDHRAVPVARRDGQPDAAVMRSIPTEALTELVSESNALFRRRLLQIDLAAALLELLRLLRHRGADFGGGQGIVLAARGVAHFLARSSSSRISARTWSRNAPPWRRRPAAFRRG